MQRASRRTSSAAGDIVRAVVDLVAETVEDADGLCARAGLDRAELSQEGVRPARTSRRADAHAPAGA